MNSEPTVFDTFDIVRTYKASPERVFTACASGSRSAAGSWRERTGTSTPSRWTSARGDSSGVEFRFKDGPEITNDTVFHDIVPNRRIVSSYGMAMAGKRFSVSLATLEIEPAGSGTRLRYTEQAAFFEGADGACAAARAAPSCWRSSQRSSGSECGARPDREARREARDPRVRAPATGLAQRRLRSLRGRRSPRALERPSDATAESSTRSPIFASTASIAFAAGPGRTSSSKGRCVTRTSPKEQRIVYSEVIATTDSGSRCRSSRGRFSRKDGRSARRHRSDRVVRGRRHDRRQPGRG